VVMADGKASEANRALALQNILSNKKLSSILLSQRGAEVGVLMREMFTNLDGSLGTGKLQAILEQADVMDDPIKFIAEQLDGKAQKMVENVFPDIYKRIENVTKIEELQKAGKPVPSYLKRFMKDGEAEKIPEVYKKAAEVHKTLQHNILGTGKGFADTNKLMAASFISVNPPVWFRNATSNATHIMVDGHNPFFTGAHMDEYISKFGGAPATVDVKMGKENAMTDVVDKVASDTKNPVKKFWNWFITRNESIEGFQAKQVAVHSMKQAMGEMRKVVFKDMKQGLTAAGFTDAETQKLFDLIYDDLDADKGIEKLFHITEHRTLSDLLSPEEVAMLDQYDLANEFSRAYKKSSNKGQAKQLFEEIMQGVDDIGKKSDVEEAVIDEGSKYAAENTDIADLPNQGAISKAEYDYIGRRNIATRNGFDSCLDTLKNFRQTTTQKLNEAIRSGAKNVPELQGIQENILKLVDDSELQFRKIREDAFRMRDAKFNRKFWNETNALRNTDQDLYMAKWREYLDYREQMFRDMAATQVEMFKKTGVTASQLLNGVDNIPPLDLTSFDNAAATIDRWNDVDIEAYNTFGKFVSKSTGEVIPNPDGDSMMSYARMMKNSEFGSVFQNLLDGLEKHYDAAIPSEVTPEKMKAIQDFLPTARGRLMEAKAKAFEFANAARESSLLDYRKKTTGDLVAAYLFPYQFWYTRTYKNWMGRILNQPGLVIAYSEYRQTMEKINADMPEWYRYQINLGKMIGLPDDNPLFFGLEQMVNPLNALTGVDYNDPRRSKDAIPAVLDAIGKFGPATHPLFAYAVAAYYAMNKDPDTAEAWAGRIAPQTKLLKDASAALGIHGTNEKYGFTPGGIEIDPIIIAEGGVDPFETKRITRKLAEMVQRGDITEEQASEAAYAHTGQIWDQAWQYAQKDPNSPAYEQRSVLSTFGGIFGAGLRGRTQEDVLNDKFFEEYALLRGIQNNLSPSEYKQKLVQLYERYPFGEYLVLSKKNDQYRDQAWAYSVLDRIQPSTLTGIAKAVGLDSGVLDKFYEEKGRIDRWDKSDKDKFMAAIRDMSVVIEIPPESTQHDYNVARIRNMQLNEYLKQQYGEDIINRMNALYDIESVDVASRQKYLQDNPDVQEALDTKSKEILSDEILNNYYGGIDALENYLQYQKRGEATKLFGDDIFDLVNKYFQVGKMGYDAKAFKDDYPQVDKYLDWNDEQTKIIQGEIDTWGQTHLPATAKNIVNPMAIMNSVGQKNLAQYLQEENPNSQIEAELAPYRTKRSEGDYVESFSQAAYIDEQAEKRWNGITDVIKEFEAAKSDPAKAQAMWASDPRISQYYKLVSGLQSQFAQAEKGNFPGSDQEMRDMVQQSMSPELYRIAGDLVAGREISKTAEKQLKRIATKLGITYSQLLMYIIQ
jgi:hypothetical protein